MLSAKMSELLNEQLKLEAMASHVYLAMASWAEVSGLAGTALFFYKHSEEERMHMLKLFTYINERGGHALVPALEAVPLKYASVEDAMTHLFKHECAVTASINGLVDHALNNKDYTTHNFLQWYVQEQMEEERLARNILDKLKLIGADKAGMYLLDKELENLASAGGGKK